MTEPTDQLARWAELCEQATPGPWSADDEHGNMPGATPAWCVSRMDGADGRYLGDLAYTVGAKEQADAEFIAAARTAVPQLLALVAAQAAQIARVRRAVALSPRSMSLGELNAYERSGALPFVQIVLDVHAALDGTEATP